MSGFFLVHRGWRDNALFKGEFSRAEAWLWLIEHACWKPTRVRIKGDTVELQRGEMSFSVRFLADKWGWSKSRVDRFLADLRDEDMIKTRSKIGTTAGHSAGQGQSILTICNYAKYQDVDQGARDNDNAESGTTAGQQRDNSGTKKNKETRETNTTEEPNGPSVVARARKIPIPDDWKPEPFGPDTKSRAIVDGWPPGEIEHQAEQFRAQHRKKADRFVDWQAAWSTWVLNSVKFGGSNGSAHQAVRAGRNGSREGDGFTRALDRVDAALARGDDPLSAQPAGRA